MKLAKGADILLATPGRLADFVNSGIIDLRELNMVVFDEADKLCEYNRIDIALTTKFFSLRLT